MTDIAQVLATTPDELFARVPADEIWAHADVLLAGDRSRELVEQIDRALEAQAIDPGRATATLLAAASSSDAFTALAAVDALLRNLAAVAPETADDLERALADQARPGSDEFRAVGMLMRLVVLARGDERFFFSAAAAAQRFPRDLPGPSAERVLAAVGLLDAGRPDAQLVQIIDGYLSHQDLETQAEAAFQRGRCEIRRAPAEPEAADRVVRLDAAADYFGRAAMVERRTDARLWSEVTLMLREFAERAEVDTAALERVRTLAQERIGTASGAGHAWRLDEDWFLLRAGQQLAAQAQALGGAERKASIAGPLLQVAAAAAHTAQLAASGLADTAVAAVIERIGVSAIASALDLRVQYARDKVRDLMAIEADGPQLEYLQALERELERRQASPKAEGTSPSGEVPAERALTFAARTISGLGMRTGSLIGDEVLHGLERELTALGVLDSAPVRDLAMAVLETLIGFVWDRTADPTLLGTDRLDYLYAQKRGAAGKGASAVEEDIRSDFLRFTVGNRDYRELVEKENRIGDGRTDVRFRDGRTMLPVETKRELRDGSIDAIAQAYLPQAQTYAALGPRLGFLLVLDLTAKAGLPERDFRTRFAVRHLEPRTGDEGWPDHVVIAVLDGNRVPPSAR